MAQNMDQLSECPDCNAQISVRATACPKCGAPVWRDRLRERTRERATGLAARLARLWSYWLARSAIFAVLLFAGMSQIDWKDRLYLHGRSEPGDEPGNERIDPLRYALRHYTVLGRATPVDHGLEQFETDPSYDPIWSDAYSEEAQIETSRQISKLSSPSFDWESFVDVRSQAHFEFLLAEAAKARFDHVGFAKRKNARLFIHVATAMEAIAYGLLLGFLPLYRRRRQDHHAQTDAAGPVVRVPSEPPRPPKKSGSR